LKALLASLRGIEQHLVHNGKSYHEFLRAATMSAGLYLLPADALDQQKPHHEDEVYYVIRGHAWLKVGEEDWEVSAGSVIFVAAELEHRFHDITEELVVMVFFAPAET
jgi:mannose-6-phosphate isomerase-like protein (cupin superfamily)